jgi:ribosomal protein S20
MTKNLNQVKKTYEEISNKADDEFKKYLKEYQKEIKEKYEKKYLSKSYN